MSNWPQGLHAIGGALGHCHLLVWERSAVLIDTGLCLVPRRLRRQMRRLGLAPEALRAILLTHGHLDHTGGLAEIKAWCGAPVFAHPAEQAHIDGTFPYRGVTQVCGAMEATGRALLRYRPVKIDTPLRDGDELPFWDGLRVVYLPGHTAGHCGFFSARENVLFSGDLFASYAFSTHLSPAVFTSHPALLPGSVARVRALNPGGLVPSHYDQCDAALHRRRFDRLIA
jgi:glyoxylase-like metal-dependent hydrolase (beta-lactamase superfamily II)